MHVESVPSASFTQALCLIFALYTGGSALAQEKSWSMQVLTGNDGPPSLVLTGRDLDRATSIVLGCARDRSSIYLTLSGYGGDALPRVEMSEMPGMLAVAGPSDTLSFDMRLAYWKSQGTWQVLDVADESAFLDAIAVGSEMKIQTKLGDPIASHDLSGIGALRDEVRRTCGV